MISREIIQKLATKFQTTEQNTRREYVQHLFLSHFYRLPKAENIYFKGGTALHLLYGNPRFSEDLDFGASGHTIQIIEATILETLEEIEREGIRTHFQESKPTSGGYLSLVSFSLYDQQILLKLEISLRKEKQKGNLMTMISEFLPPYLVSVLTQEYLAVGKIQALLNRKKPRDFYDMYFLLRANLISPKEKNILPKVLEALDQSDIHFERELKEFLPRSHWSIIRHFPDVLKQEIKRFSA